MSLFPHLVEKRIEEARDRGAFENLPGLGKPIPDLDEPYDELWWIRRWMQREGLDPAAELRAEGTSPKLVEALDLVAERRRTRG